MKILCPLKRVPDPAQKTKLKDGAIDLTGATWIVNTFDEYAVETALRLIENAADGSRAGEVVVVTVGPEDAAQRRTDVRHRAFVVERSPRRKARPGRTPG